MAAKSTGSAKKKQSDSKFSYTRFEKMLNARATWRNVNTVVRLAAKYSQPSDEGRMGEEASCA